MKIAIIGAGVSGLAAARFLDEFGFDVEIFEAAPGPQAGLLETRDVDGYAFDVGGGHIIYSKDPWFGSFLKELYPDNALVELERRTKIFYKDRFVKYPFENGLSDLPIEANYECLLGFIKAYMEKPGKEVPKNFRDWIFYRMGEGIAKHFMLPYNEKIWNSDLSDMGVEWVAGRVPEAPIEDIVRSSLGGESEGYTHQSVFQYPLNNGIQDLASRLSLPIRHKIHYNHEVKRIRKNKSSGFDVDGAPFDQVVMTLPLDQTPKVVEGMPEASARAAESLEFISVTSFLFGMEEEDSRPYSWIYLPFPEDGPANRITYLSNYSPNNAPAGKASILAEVTHKGQLKVNREYEESLKQYLIKTGFLHKDRVTVQAHGTIKHAYIYFDLDFSNKRNQALEGLKSMGLHPLGRFGRYNYHNIDHCMIDAKHLAEKIQKL